MPKVPVRSLAPRFHILGPGGIGSLFAYYFHQHYIPFTFFQRRAPPPTSQLQGGTDRANRTIRDGGYAENSSSIISGKGMGNTRAYPPTTLKYMNLTALETASVEPQVIDGLDWEPLYPIIDKELFRYDPIYNELSRSPIHQLLVTTKTYQTVEAISKIRHRLRPWTTIVLMQNGMGAREEICESMGWTDEAERPNFVQGIISHGAQKTDDTVVHTGWGEVWLAPVVDSSSRSASASTSTSTAAKKTTSTTPCISEMLQLPEDGSLFPTLVPPAKNILSTPYPITSPAPYLAPFKNAPFSTLYPKPSSSTELQALRTRSLYETLAAFQQLSKAMGLHILMPDRLLALQLSKLVVNACVNPVATLLEATNGTLLDSAQANQAVKDLLKESHTILSRSKEVQSLDKELRQKYLTLETLTKTTEGILKATRQNQCSTLQDYLRGSQECEIEYMNGYLIKMAERDRDLAGGSTAENVAPLNRMVTEKIKEKFAAPRKTIE
ncbi:2-dehydropantoate 2-reductase (Ketopantoate reductase) (KPA reductase) (KPR) [Haplosporangium sp. Z 767]|nr:2-dehydropantoate 2-reductase (Ketopantoate reductase) (KPA reductase) (KPR) [Haplosporangium sp. Z 767]KAF9179445.1 2-dehydropantoate 2-reductase (Ketopantoate reductase) (KPA reductase) (KPR) [Haplosporangium sp. Z 11]